MTKFSVIITTRDRPSQFAAAAESVLCQKTDDFELVVVDDGSAEEHLEAYGAVEASCRDRLGARAVFVHLPRRHRGHGQSFAINTGFDMASGDYICFLDDDDCWIDDEYLRTVARNLTEVSAPVDLHYARQMAYINDVKVERRVWIEGVEDALRRRHGALDPRHSYPVAVADLIATGNHVQVNTMIVSRGLFSTIGGFDEQNRYDPDRDFYLRAIDRARGIRYMPAAVARHNVPTKGTSMSNIVTRYDRLIYQNRMCDKVILFGETPAVRDHAFRLKRYAVKHMAEELYRQGRFREASFYARQALLIGFNLKWLAFTLWMGLRSLVGRGASTKGHADSGHSPGEDIHSAFTSDDSGRNHPPRQA